MFFRPKQTPSGRVLQLLEPYRNAEGKPRHRVVASLGNAAIAEGRWPLIAKAVERRLLGREELFAWDYDLEDQKWIDRIVRQVDLQGRWRPIDFSKLRRVRGAAARAAGETEDSAGPALDGVLVEAVGHEQTTALGPALAGRQAWKALRLDECLADLGLNESQRLAAAAEVINRLVDPQSENALESWLRSTAMPELFGEKILAGGRDRFYRVSDALLARREPIEAHLRGRQREVFSLRRTLFLYDLTNTYFEGQAQKNPKAKRGGNSKHKRTDCPQIVVGMVFDEHGFELSHRIFEGNRTDSPTLVDMVRSLQQAAAEEADLFGAAQAAPMVVVDAGLASDKNLKVLRAAGFRYLVNDTRNGRSAYRERFLEDEAFHIIEGREKKRAVRVRVIEDVQGGAGPPDRLMLCKSEGRQEKEQAIRSQAEQRLVEELDRLVERVRKRRLTEPKKMERAIGRILAHHPRAARFYTVEVVESPSGAAAQIVYQCQHDLLQADQELFGCYVLRTDNEALADEELWQTYMVLSRAEDGFRALKSNLGLRPNRHHVEPRVDAHVFITILAYHLLRFLLFTLESKGDHRSWETLKRILATHCYTTIVLPTTRCGTVRTRKAGAPDEQQKAIYRHLGVEWRNLPVVTEQLP